MSESFVTGVVNYLAPMSEKPRYFAKDQSQNRVSLDPQPVMLRDARAAADAPTLAREGFTLVDHRSAVADFGDQAQREAIYPAEIQALLQRVTGADRLIISSPPIVRYSERSPLSGQAVNSHPARFIHVDIAPEDSAAQALRMLGGDEAEFKSYRRFALYNVWRVFSPPPQDLPLAMCDARSFAADELVRADAIFDGVPGREFQFESYLLRYSPAHRWFYYPDMTRDEALLFKTFDSDPAQPVNVPHTAFDHPNVPADVGPRSSVEIRACAYFRA